MKIRIMINSFVSVCLLLALLALTGCGAGIARSADPSEIDLARKEEAKSADDPAVTAKPADPVEALLAGRPEYRLVFEGEAKYAMIMLRPDIDHEMFWPMTDDAELLADFTEMLRGLRFVNISNEEYAEYFMEERLADYIEEGPIFTVYDELGGEIGTVEFLRAKGKDSVYSAEAPGWSRLAVVFLNDPGSESGYSMQFCVITQGTFDEGMLEAVWNRCLQGLTVEQYLYKMDNEKDFVPFIGAHNDSFRAEGRIDRHFGSELAE